MLKSKKPSVWLFGSIGTLCVAGVLLGVSIFVLAQEQSRRDMLLQERASMSTSERHAAALRALARDTVTLRGDMDDVALDHDVSSIVSFLENTASIAGVQMSIDAVTTAGEEKEEHTTQLDLVMRVNGSFTSIVHFVRLLETIPRAVLVDSVQLEYADESWGATIRMRIITTT